MDVPQLKRVHAVVEGRVQGVGFRNFVMDEAARLNLTGWVRNTRDGSVEVTAEGSESALSALLVSLRRGPRMAAVIQVREDWSESSGEFSHFRMRMTE